MPDRETSSTPRPGPSPDAQVPDLRDRTTGEDDPHEVGDRQVDLEGREPMAPAPEMGEGERHRADTALPAIADDSARPDESGTPAGPDLGAGAD